MLTRILLFPPWEEEAAISRLQQSASSKRSKRVVHWMRLLVRAVFEVAEFGQRPPTTHRLESFLRQDPSLEQIRLLFGPDISSWMKSVDWADLPPPCILPRSSESADWAVPQITTSGQLAAALNLSVRRLEQLSDCRGGEQFRTIQAARNYRYRWQRRRTGGYRLIEASKPELRAAQRWVLQNILNRIPIHSAAHAYRRGRSPMTNAEQHINRRIVLRFDLRNFFGQISGARVRGIFRLAGFPDTVAARLNGLCTNTAWQGIQRLPPFDFPSESELPNEDRILFGPHLPQGAPTSPALANLCAWKLDCRLAGLSARFQANYTRYADDLIFSGDFDFARRLTSFRRAVLAIVHDEQFEIRAHKTRLMYASQRQQVTGYVVNSRINTGRREFDRLKATLYNCVRFGPNAQNRSNHSRFRQHLQGRIEAVRHANAVRGLRLQKLFDQICWPDDSDCKSNFEPPRVGSGG
jgi:hypothetical protein